MRNKAFAHDEQMFYFSHCFQKSSDKGTSNGLLMEYLKGYLVVSWKHYISTILGVILPLLAYSTYK